MIRELLPSINKLEEYHASIAVILSRARRHLFIFVSTFVISFLGLGLLFGAILLIEKYLVYVILSFIGFFIGALVVSLWSSLSHYIYHLHHPNKIRSTEGMPRVANRIKRLLDLSVVSIMIFLQAPLLVIIALYVKITSPGPILFTQQRIGLNGRRFYIYKFRTMFVEPRHSDEAAITFSLQRDPRITPIGGFLRITGLDELPQLINVLKGDMSLVGPRPIPVRVYEEMNQAQRRKRFSVRPGITGLYQIQWRDSIPFEEWLELDEQYIDRWSIWLDLKILAMTFLVVLRGYATDLKYPHGGSDKFEEVFFQAKHA